MRATYVPMDNAATGGRGARPRRRDGSVSAARVGVLLAAVLLDLMSIAVTATLLWLGAGTTVLSGEPLVMAVAFAGGALLAGAAAFLRPPVAGGTAATALLSVVVLAGGLTCTSLLVGGYFFAWVVLYAAASLGAGAMLALIIEALSDRKGGAVLWRGIVLAASIVAVLLLNRVWSDSALLGDVLVFTFLLNAAALGLGVAARSVRRSEIEAPAA